MSKMGSEDDAVLIPRNRPHKYDKISLEVPVC